MVKYVVIRLNGMIINIAKAYKDIVKLQWLAIRQSNIKFSISFEEYSSLEKRIRPSIIVENGQNYWQKFWKHALIEVGVNPTPSVLEKVQNKFRTLMINSSELYADVKPFIEESRKKNIKVVLLESSDNEYVNKTLEKFGLSSLFNRVEIIKESGANEKEFFQKASENLKTEQDEIVFMCSRFDKDYRMVSELGMRGILVTRRFFSSFNKPESIQNTTKAMNLLKAIDLIEDCQNEEETADDFYKNHERTYEEAVDFINNQIGADKTNLETEDTIDLEDDFDDEFPPEFETIGSSMSKKEKEIENKSDESDCDKDYEDALKILRSRIY